jgi:hypothetical protein
MFLVWANLGAKLFRGAGLRGCSWGKMIYGSFQQESGGLLRFFEICHGVG